MILYPSQNDLMLAKTKSFFSNLSYFVFWLILAVLATLVAFQMHTTLVSISITVIENPAWRPTGWSLNTIYGLSRVFWLFIGILWLLWVMFTEAHLREGKNRELLLKRFGIFVGILAIIYALNYGILLLVV
jgi:hypothetical protein